jgi:TetR/AcrR family transcriptional regulator
MSNVAQRRGEERERRRNEIIVAAEALYAKSGWNALTVGQVARSTRLSRAMVYVYFRDKDELLFAIGERAMRLLRDRFIAAAVGQATGLDKVQAIGRAYMGYAYEFPHFFDFCSRFQAHSESTNASSHEGACRIAGDHVIGVVAQAIETGIGDGSIRHDVGEPVLLAMTLWAFMHTIIQVALVKGVDLTRSGIAIADLIKYAFGLIRWAVHGAAAHGSEVTDRSPSPAIQ